MNNEKKGFVKNSSGSYYGFRRKSLFIKVFFVVLALIVFLGKASAGSDWENVSPSERIRAVLADDALAGWVIVGDFDIDHDGDLDRLVGHEKDFAVVRGQKYVYVSTYFNENGEYYFNSHVSEYMLPINGAEFRRLKGGPEERVIASYVQMSPDRPGLVAMWFSREGGLETIEKDDSPPP